MHLVIRPTTLRCPRPVLDRVQRRLATLARSQRIEEATLRVSEESERSPRFTATLALRVPGPDVHAEGRDHTPGTAVQRALTSIERQLLGRKQKRVARRNEPRRAPIPGHNRAA